MGDSAPSRFVKLRQKTPIVEFSSTKVVGQKSDTVINVKLFLNVSWHYWKGWRYAVKWNSIKKFVVYVCVSVA